MKGMRHVIMLAELLKRHARLGRPEQCIGKKITATARSYFGTIGLRFDDGSYLYGQAEGGSCDEEATISFGWPHPEPGEARDLGLISAEEYAAIERAEQEDREAADRAQFERLKAKFEVAPAAPKAEG